MKYFVTGATGFVGGRVARRLNAAGHEVIVVVRNPEKAKDLSALGMRVVKGDVTDKESMRTPMAGVDGVFHIAGWYKVGVRDTRDGQSINVDGTRNVLALMKEHRIPKGVYTSTLAINSHTRGKLVDEHYRFNGQHVSVYDRTKAEAHRIADQFIADGLPLVTVMPGLIYGPGDTSSARQTLIQYLKRQLPMLPQGAAYCWAHIDDIAEAHIAAMEKGRVGEAYIIGGPAHTLVEALHLAQTITGIPAPLSAPAGLFGVLSAMMGVIEKIIPVPESYTSEGLRVIAGVTYLGDNGKARKELGYNPRSLKDGLTDTLHHEMTLLGMKN